MHKHKEHLGVLFLMCFSQMKDYISLTALMIVMSYTNSLILEILTECPVDVKHV